MTQTFAFDDSGESVERTVAEQSDGKDEVISFDLLGTEVEHEDLLGVGFDADLVGATTDLLLLFF